MIPWYQKHMVWYQNEVSSSIILRDISFLIKAQIVMVAILDFSILSKLLKDDSSTPVWISLWGCQTWIIRREKHCIKQNKVKANNYYVGLVARLKWEVVLCELHISIFFKIWLFFSKKVVRAPTNIIIVTIYYLRDICIGQNNHNQQYLHIWNSFGTLMHENRFKRKLLPFDVSPKPREC